MSIVQPTDTWRVSDSQEIQEDSRSLDIWMIDNHSDQHLIFIFDLRRHTSWVDDTKPYRDSSKVLCIHPRWTIPFLLSPFGEEKLVVVPLSWFQWWGSAWAAGSGWSRCHGDVAFRFLGWLKVCNVRFEVTMIKVGVPFLLLDPWPQRICFFLFVSSGGPSVDCNWWR